MSTPSTPARQEVCRLLRRNRGLLTVALALIVSNRVAGLAIPAASRYVVDDVIGRQKTERLSLVALLACAAVAIETATAFWASQVAGVAGQRAAAGLRREMQTRVLGLPLERFDLSSAGSLAARIATDTDQIRYLIGNGLVQLITSFLSASFALTLLFVLNPWLTLRVLPILCLALLLVSRSVRGIARALESVLRQQAALTGWLSQILGGIRLVKAYAAERHEAAQYACMSHQLLRDSVNALRRVSFLNAGSTLAAGALGVMLLVVGGDAVATGDMTLGSYVMYAWLTGFLLGPVLHVAASAPELGKAIAAAARIAELRSVPTEDEEDRWKARLPSLQGSVEFLEVSWGYVPGRFALRQVSLHAPAGSTTALVGPNGSGKSTLCRLLLAYHRPSRGSILVDGHDIGLLHRRAYRSLLGVVLQEDALFEGTIVDNIRYGRPRASMSEARAAGRLAHCDEFVDCLPDGYATQVGERGLRLSAGQRQRVAIARALLADPRILILDEATSSLDPESQELIQAALQVLCQGRTTFLVAHRLSTVRTADQILVLDRGVIVERGNHDELLRREGRYLKLCRTLCVGGREVA